MQTEWEKNTRPHFYLCHFSDGSYAVQSFHYSVIVLFLYDKEKKNIIHLQAFASHILLEKHTVSVHAFSIKASVKAKDGT